MTEDFEPEPVSVPAQPQPVVSQRKKTTFTGDILRLVTGTTAAQVITVLLTPVLARLFVPADFGVFNLYVSLITVLGIIACLRYELAIVLPESDHEAANLLAVSLVFAVLTSLLTIPFIVLWGDDFSILLKEPRLNIYLWSLPISVVFGGVYLALNNWNTRTHQFTRLSIARVVNNSLTSLSQTGAGLAGLRVAGSLIFGNLFGTVVATLVLIWRIWVDDCRLFIQSINLKTMLEVISRYRKFPMYSIWGGLLNNLSWQLPSFLLTFYFSSDVNGYYGLGIRTLQLPMSLIGGAIAQAFLPRASQALKSGNLKAMVTDVYRRLVDYSLFPLLVLALVGRDLFLIVFGTAWGDSGTYVQILSVWLFFWFISSPMSQLFVVLEKQEQSLRIHIAIFVTRLLSLMIGGYFHSPILAIALFSITGVLTYGYLSLIIIAATGVSGRDIWTIIYTRILQFLPVGAVLIVLKLLHASIWITSIIAVLVVGAYGVYTILHDAQIMQTLAKIPWLKKLGIGSLK